MKVFQIRLSTVLILFISLIASTILIPNSLAQEDTQIPGWIKNVAGWWANGEIAEKEFLTAIEYLINNNIISLSAMPCSIFDTSSTGSVPGWVKNNAKWWSEDLIEDTDFINGIKYLIKKQIISIDNKKIVGKVQLEDVIFSPFWVFEKNSLAFVASSFFEVYGTYGDCVTVDSGNGVWQSLALGLNPNKVDEYNEVAVWNDPQKTVVVYSGVGCANLVVVQLLHSPV